MALRQIQVHSEIHKGSGGSQGLFLLGDTIDRLRALMPEWEGRIRLIYMDPPYLTGSRFYMHCRLGSEDWRRGVGSLSLPAFEDCADRPRFLEMMREVLTLCRALLRDDGAIFVHVDYRACAHLRLLMDELFGEKNFLNEIIWVYQTGGRSTRHFSRKHDNILFYSKSSQFEFYPQDVMVPPPAEGRRNHMRRHVDPDGRVYRSIRSNGKVYTYYDDEPIVPIDVWTDVSHLQQRDPQRTGYDTQKPVSLLERIIKCASRPGDWVLDPFAGSGTTLEAAKGCGRHFIGIDRCPMTANIARRRLEGAQYRLESVNGEEQTSVCYASVETGVGFYHVTLEGFEAPAEGLPEPRETMERVDNWSLGYLRDGGYEVMSAFARSRRKPELQRELSAPVYSGQLALCISDVTGRSYYFALPPAGEESFK